MSQNFIMKLHFSLVFIFASAVIDISLSTNNCNCPKTTDPDMYTMSYNCSVLGGNFTVWSITTSSGANCRITLSHNVTEKFYGYCNYVDDHYWPWPFYGFASISRYAENNSYTSYLHVQNVFDFPKFHNGSIIECYVRDDELNETLVYSTTMLIPEILYEFSYNCSTIIDNQTLTVWSVVTSTGHTLCDITLPHYPAGNNVRFYTVPYDCHQRYVPLHANVMINIDNNSSTSHLNLYVFNHSIFSNGSTIVCHIFNDYTYREPIYSITYKLDITSISFSAPPWLIDLPSPTDLRLTDIIQQQGYLQLIFNWTYLQPPDPESQHCFYDRFYFSGCYCSSTPRDYGGLVCHLYDHDPEFISNCDLTVYIIANSCFYWFQSTRTNISVYLADSAPTIIKCIPHYSMSDRSLTKLTTVFNITETFISSDGIMNPIITYNLTYSSSISNANCGSANMPASFCENGVCEHTFEVTSSLCPTDVNVTVFATSAYGRGLASYPPLKIDHINKFITVEFDEITNTVTCEFLNQHLDNVKECIVHATHGAECNQNLGIYNASDAGTNIISIVVPSQQFSRDVNEYCLTVTAKSLDLMVIVEGFEAQNLPQGLDINGLNMTTITITVVVILVLIISIIIVVLHYLRKQKSIIPAIELNGKVVINEAGTSTEAEKANELNIGDLTIYKKRQLGSGMFGYVFEGKLQGKPCAVKVLHEVGTLLISNLPTISEGGAVQEARLNSFKKEGIQLLHLKHPNIVELYDIFPYPEHDLPCLVMELLDCSLRDYFNEISELPFSHQISLSCDIAKALAYLHENKILHRDLCGDNILIKKENFEAIPVAKIADFGMSRIFDMETMTHSVSVLGHRNGYLPPEGPSKDYDVSLDIYMFGVVMVQIVHTIPDIRSPEDRYRLIDDVNNIHPMHQVIKSCVMTSKIDRPNAKKISDELQSFLIDE